ncbi:methyltransferase domain-containing protein [Saccharopolyspora sp. NPDC000359]|uniref:methyltransferase domain-containing protein n=1 Tax=Saccharopolyspora sp. NPDC000359 TaxID=3154251 RepID=UPI00332B705A
MIYEHPLAYLLGMEGVALLRSFTGEHDRDPVAERIAEVLAGHGHRVIGVDSSPEMLARVPAGEFAVGELTGLPVEDAAADLVMCALAGQVSHGPGSAGGGPGRVVFAGRLGSAKWRSCRPSGSAVRRCGRWPRWSRRRPRRPARGCPPW